MSFYKPLFPTGGGFIYKNIEGPTGPIGNQGQIGSTGNQGEIGPTGPRGARGIAGGNGGTPFFLNFSQNSATQHTPLLSDIQTTNVGSTKTYNNLTSQKFETNLNIIAYPKTISGGVYNLYLYAYADAGGSFNTRFTLSTSKGIFAESGLYSIKYIIKYTESNSVINNWLRIYFKFNF